MGGERASEQPQRCLEDSRAERERTRLDIASRVDMARVREMGEEERRW